MKCRGLAKVYAGRVMLMGLAVASLVQAASALVPGDTTPPMDRYVMATGNVILIPRGVDRVRGIYLNHLQGTGIPSESHNDGAMCTIWKFALIYMKDGLLTPAETQNFQLFFDNAAKASGHPEVSNVPVIYETGRWLSKALVLQVKNKLIVATVWDTPDDATVLTKNTLTLCYRYEDNHAAFIEATPSAAAPVRAAGYPLGYYPVWGWTRGHFSGKVYAWAVYDWAARNLIPDGPVPADGKMTIRPINLESGWLGDPSTWNGSWPKAYKYADYPGDKSMAPWIPDEYCARVWRSVVSKHPTLTNRENTQWGIMREGTHGDNTYSNSSPPMVGVLSPISIYNKDPYTPIMIPRDTTLRLQIGCGYADLKELRVYDGLKLLATLAPNAYKVWFAQCAFTTPGVRAVIVEATLASGEKVTSWPASIFVASAAPSTSVNRIDSGNERGPGAASVGRVALRAKGGISVRLASRASQTLTIGVADLGGRTVKGITELWVSGKVLNHFRGNNLNLRGAIIPFSIICPQ